MAKEENIILPVLAGVAILAFISQDSKPSPTSPAAPGSGLTPTNYIKLYWPDALHAQLQTNVPALVTITQGGLESGWGKSAPGNNHFGIKAGSSWAGPTQLLKTWECGKSGDAAKDGIRDKVLAIYKPGDPSGVCGTADLQDFYDWHMYCDKYKMPGEAIIAGSMYSYRVLGKFRKYASARDSFIDHGVFLSVNPRYKKAFLYTKDPYQFAREIAAAHYATDPNYASKLVSSMRIVSDVLKRHGMI